MSTNLPAKAVYGTWESKIHAEAVAAQSLSAGIEEVILDTTTSKVYFAQKRPEENGRSAIVDASACEDFFGQSWDARTQVHEYGGGAAIISNGVLYFSHILDHRVYKTTKGGTPEAITPEKSLRRFADFTVHPKHHDLIVCTVEDHTGAFTDEGLPDPTQVQTYLAAIDAKNGAVSPLVVPDSEPADFYACARFSPDGDSIAWQQWYHPELPWQSAEIMVAAVEFVDRKLSIKSKPTNVAGKNQVAAAQDPNWASNNTLFFTCDISGYHNPWKFVFDPANLAAGKASPILHESIEEEFGVPQWFLSRHGSAALSDTKVAFVSFRKGRSVLYICDLTRGDIVEVPTPYAHIQYLQGDRRGKIVMLGQPSDTGEVLAELTMDSDGKPHLKSLSPPAVENPGLPLSYISPGEYLALTLPPDNRTCHVTYYAPKNPKYSGGLGDEKPPVVVLIHGGPWYMETANLDWKKQFFTSRGWAYVDVNYGGSTGFGHAYRESLLGKWGVLDVEDALESVLQLAARGLVDPKRAVVHGGSAGGYTVLQLATTRPKAFAAGSAHYGVSDMHKLHEELHKFERHLCPRLMGGTWEECESVWRERSPFYHADKIEMPLLILQGEEDTVISPAQMKQMEQKIKDRGTKVHLELFPGEGHGWRQSSTIQKVLELEIQWFSEAVILKLADK